MAFARPNNDVSVGVWTPTPLWQQIDEVTFSDADKIDSGNNPVNETCEVGLSDVTDPAASTGHVVRYRYGKGAAGAKQIDLTVDLVQGTSVLATWSHTAISSSKVTAAQTLSGAQADSITNYADLRLRFTANGVGGGSPASATVTWAELEVPDSGPAAQTVSPAAIGLAAAVQATSRIDQVAEPALISRGLAAAEPSIPTIVEPAAHASPLSVQAPTRIDQTTQPEALGAAGAPVAPAQMDQELTATLLSAAAAAVPPGVRVSVNPTAIASPASAVAADQMDQEARPALISLPASAAAPAMTIAVNPASLALSAAAGAPDRVDQEAAPGGLAALATAVALASVDQAVAGALLGSAAAAPAPTISQDGGGQTVSPPALAASALAVAPAGIDQQLVAQLLSAAAAAAAPSVSAPGQEVAPGLLSVPMGAVAFLRLDQAVSPAAIAAAAALIAPAGVDQQVVAQLIAAAVGTLAPEVADTIVAGGSPPAGAAVTFVALGFAGPGPVPSGSATHSTPEH